MHLAPSCRSLLVVVALGGAACASSQPVGAAEHRERAAEDEASAAEHAARYDENARATRLTPAPGDGVAQLREYNPTHFEIVAAAGHTNSAERHRKSALALEASEEAACTSIAPAARSACPLLSPLLIEDASGGVRLTFPDEAHATKAAALIRCQQAFAKARAFEDLPTCALYAPGLKLDQSGAVVVLSAKADADIARLRSNIRGHH